jgi:hypothetical protein
VFWINLPIGAVTFVMFGLFLHENRAPRRHRVDYLGSVLMMFGTGALMLALVEFGNSAAIPTSIALAAAGIGAFAVLGVHERGAAEPILPLKLWRDRVIALGSFSGFTGGVVMMSINGFLPLYVQGAMGCSPTAAGMVLGAASVSWTFASLAAGRLMIRTSYRRAAIIGGVSLIAGTAVLITLGPASHLLWAATGSLLIGIGMGFCNTAFLVSTQASAGFDQRGMATSSIMFMRIVGKLGRCRRIRRYPQFRGRSAHFPRRRRHQPPVAAGGPARARHRRDRPAERGDRRRIAQCLRRSRRRRNRQPDAGMGLAGTSQPDTPSRKRASRPLIKDRRLRRSPISLPDLGFGIRGTPSSARIGADRWSQWRHRTSAIWRAPPIVRTVQLSPAEAAHMSDSQAETAEPGCAVKGRPTVEAATVEPGEAMEATGAKSDAGEPVEGIAVDIIRPVVISRRALGIVVIVAAARPDTAIAWGKRVSGWADRNRSAGAGRRSA